jgi:hypothetical protein
MGTSSARRAPTTWLWRRAKGAATRYLAPEGGAGLEARELVGRYLAALGEEAGSGSQGLLAAFRLTRKVGQNLGAFVDEVFSRGWDAALETWGLTGGAGLTLELPAPVLGGTLIETDGSLEGAVARSSLAAVLQDFDPTEKAAPAQVVTRFLAESLYQRLILDLGEPLEAASRGYDHWQQGLYGLRSWIVKTGALEGPEEPPRPEQWRGLAGWQWVTLALEEMLQCLLK